MAEAKVTVKGREKLCKAHAGDITLSPIKWIAFGDGGTDADKVVIAVTGEEEELHNELLRLEVAHDYPVSTTCNFTSLLKNADLANETINEYGFFDADGDLVLYKTFKNKEKDDDMEFGFEVKEIW